MNSNQLFCDWGLIRGNASSLTHNVVALSSISPQVTWRGISGNHRLLNAIFATSSFIAWVRLHRRSPCMATRPANTQDVAPSQIKRRWHCLSLRRVAVLLAIVLCISAIWLANESEDAYVNYSAYQEVYMPEKYGVGVVAKKNISVRHYYHFLNL
jgi:hypothetical protein